MPKLKFVGTDKMLRYTGDDVDCRTGDIIDVSQEKYDQLMNDCPMWFDKDVEKVIETPKQEPVVVPSISKKEINEIALKNEISLFNKTNDEVEQELKDRDLLVVEETPKKKVKTA